MDKVTVPIIQTALIVLDRLGTHFKCRKTKTKVITLANQKRHRQSREPIKTRIYHLPFIYLFIYLQIFLKKGHARN